MSINEQNKLSNLFVDFIQDEEDASSSAKTSRCDFLRNVAMQTGESVTRINDSLERYRHAFEAFVASAPCSEQTVKLLHEILEELRAITALLSAQTQFRGHISKVLPNISEKTEKYQDVTLALDSVESHQPILERLLHELRNAVLEHERQRP